MTAEIRQCNCERFSSSSHAQCASPRCVVRGPFLERIITSIKPAYWKGKCVRAKGRKKVALQCTCSILRKNDALGIQCGDLIRNSRSAFLRFHFSLCAQVIFTENIKLNLVFFKGADPGPSSQVWETWKIHLERTSGHKTRIIAA